MDSIELLNKLYSEDKNLAFDKYKHMLFNIHIRIANSHNEQHILKHMLLWKQEH